MSNVKEMKLVLTRNEEILTAIKGGNVEKAIDTVCQHLDENNGRYSAVVNNKGCGIDVGVLILKNTTLLHCQVVFKGVDGVERPLFTAKYNNDLSLSIISIDDSWKSGNFEALFLAMDKSDIH